LIQLTVGKLLGGDPPVGLVWKVKAVTIDAAEDGVPWEPFAVTTGDDGEELILCKTVVEVETSDKATENSGSLYEWEEEDGD
jgi:hypothetical protein